MIIRVMENYGWNERGSGNEKRINELYLQVLRFGLASLNSLQVGDVGSDVV